MSTLEIKGLVASVAGKQILNGIDLTVHSGEVHAIMGPNGAGKSTLSAVIMGKPGYEVHAGQVLLDGVDLLGLPAWQRAQAGMHLVMQYPSEVPGVGLTDMLSEAFRARGRSTEGLAAEVAAEAQRIGFADRLLDRSLNVDLSGGEKKRNETLQLAMLQPKFAILDELDSGLDIDALRDCSRRVEAATNEPGPNGRLGVIAITHYNRLLEELHPDRVHILVKGRIVETGGPELADRLEVEGYEAFTGGEPEGATTGKAGRSALDDLFAL
ncbi:MAG TPA: Fe-S cluster assembly ATPase SufC [Ilumatobacteraceae bacterium]|nr:Fe-S cluster assembly ATPase SufC [Ilumatobacteraceae bacterium]